jgi:hypothetical protein
VVWTFKKYVIVALNRYFALVISLFEKYGLLGLKLILLYCHRSIFRGPPGKIFTILGAVASTLGNKILGS